MTVNETIQAVRMLLDDSRDWYTMDRANVVAEIESAINESQMKFIKEAYTKGEERALRMLYRQSAWVVTGVSIVDDNGQPVLYPRLSHQRKDVGIDTKNSVMGAYVTEDMFFNYEEPDHGYSETYPRQAAYTMVNGWDATAQEYQTKYHFTGADSSVGKLFYIAQPRKFVATSAATPTGGSIQGLELPEEYHMRIVSMAAEMLNDIDVGEMERGERAFENQSVALEDIGREGGG